jgi:hypothetical protein
MMVGSHCGSSILKATLVTWWMKKGRAGRQLTVLLDMDEYERVQRATVRLYESFAKEDGSGLSNVLYEGENGATVKIKFPRTMAGGQSAAPSKPAKKGTKRKDLEHLVVNSASEDEEPTPKKGKGSKGAKKQASKKE